MTICEDCRLNDCDSCYEHDCDCNLASHTLSAAIALSNGAELIEGLNCGVRPRDLSKPVRKQTSFNMTLNGRTYRVTVKA